MTRDIALPLLAVVLIGGLGTAAGLIARAVNRSTREAIRNAAIPVLVTTTFTCQHMTIAGGTSASCGICGPLPVRHQLAA